MIAWISPYEESEELRVDSEVKEPQTPAGSAPATNPPAAASFYEKRQRVYTGLLLFVVVAGLPIVSVPSLRNRLSTRVMALKTAMAGRIEPVIAQVGENPEPFPEEYHRPAPPLPKPPQLPPLERIFTLERSSPPLPPPAEKPSVAQAPRILTIPRPAAQTEETEEETATAPAASDETGLNYQQGKSERDAYDLLITTNPAVAEMVQGGNPAFHFLSWDAANRGDDTYWVRLKFQSEESPSVEYIWQVKLQERQVVPLNYNARTIS